MSRNYSLGKASKGDVSDKTSFKRNSNITLGKVIATDDPEAAGRIKVRVRGVDDKKTDSEIPYCWPFLPLHINIQPKVDETVKVIFYDPTNDNSYREYIGPLVPQLGDKLNYSDNFNDSTAGREGSRVPFFESIKNIPTTKFDLNDGTSYDLYPKYDEISILGRNNSDLVFKDSEVIIRAGKSTSNDANIINKRNPAYIQIKSFKPGKYETDVTIESTPNNKDKSLLSYEKNIETRTDIKMVSNKIFLIGRDSDSGIVNPFLTEEEQAKLETSLHPIPYGDILEDFIMKVWRWIQTHTHPYHNLPTNPAESAYINIENWINTELPKLNSKNIFAGGDIPTKTQQETNVKVKPTQAKDYSDKLPTIDNSTIIRVDEQKSPSIGVTGDWICDSITCQVTLRVINLVTSETIISFTSIDPDVNVAYSNTITQLDTYFTGENIDTSNINIPTFNELENY